MAFLPKTQRAYEDEAARLVTVLRRWYDLEVTVKQLEWELNRCLYPETALQPAPAVVRKPDMLRRAEEGKPLLPEKNQGHNQRWADRYERVKSHREYYEQNTSRLDDRVQRLTMQVADCRQAGARQRHGSEAAEIDAIVEQVKKALQQEQGQGPQTSQPPDEDAPPRPTELERVRRDLKRARQQHQALQDGKMVLEQGLTALQDRVDDVEARLRRKERDLEAARDEVVRLKEEHAQNQQRFAALETMRELARRFMQGQRSFLFLHNDPQLDNALAGLVDYSLARLALALTAADAQGVRAMCANLHAIAHTLKTYQGNPIHALEQALAMVSRLEDAAGAAPSLPPAAERQPPEAKPFLVRLKYLRDLARLDLRPFYFFDDQNKIQRIG